MNRIHDLLSAVAGLWKFLGPNAPDSSHIFARSRIREGTLAGKLIAFLPVFSSALAIALAGNHRRARAFAPNVARRKSNINYRRTVFDALRVMLETARMHQDGALRFSNPTGSSLNRFRWNTSNLGCFVGVPLSGIGGYILKPCGVLTNEL